MRRRARLGPSLGFGLLGQGCEGDLGGVEELGAVFVLDGSCEHGGAGAGDEVADILIAREWGHGEAKGFAGAALGGVQVSGLLQGLRVDLLPDLGAKGDGGVFEGGIEGCFRALGGGRLDGLDHGGISGSGPFLAAFSIVRRGRVIMCKRVTRFCAPFDPGHFGVCRGFLEESEESDG